MYDPETLGQAVAAGVGGTVSPVSLGGKLDPAHAGAPVVVDAAVVLAITDGKFAASPGSVGEGGARDLGTMALLRIDNVDVLVNARRTQSFDEGALTLAGVDVPSLKVVGIKSSTHFRGGWAPVASKILTADEPGFSSNRLETFEAMRRHEVVRWPIDDRAAYGEETSEEALAVAAVNARL
jgi:microcystin degradation protein MlrC